MDVPKSFLSTLKAGFFSSARARLETALLAGRRDGRWFERFAEMCQGLTLRGRSHPGLRPLANLSLRVSRLLPAVSFKSHVAAAGGARKRKLLAHPGHKLGPRNPRRVVRSRLLGRVSRVAAASCGAPVVRMPTGRGLLPLADIPFCHAM